MRLKDIEAQDIRAYVKHLREQGARPPTIREALVPLKAMLAMAAEDGHIASNPCQGIRLDVGTASGGNRRAMTRAELKLVLAAVPEEWQPFFTFLVQTGLRIPEVVGLQWQDVDLGTRPHITVQRQCYQGKVQPLKTSHSHRDVPLSPSMAATLLGMRANRYGSPGSPVWATARGKRLDDHNLRARVLRPTVAELGMPWIGFHTFRHTCASILIEAGRTIKQVQLWLGHADPAFTLRAYVHLMDEGVGSADVLDDVAGLDVQRGDNTSPVADGIPPVDANP
jgi:integrase